MGKKKVSVKITKNYEALHRYFAGLTILLFVVTALGTLVAGGSTLEIGWRSVVVVIGALIIGRILVKVWVHWDTISDTTSRNE
jgi:hypothetical protein